MTNLKKVALFALGNLSKLVESFFHRQKRYLYPLGSKQNQVYKFLYGLGDLQFCTTIASQGVARQYKLTSNGRDPTRHLDIASHDNSLYLFAPPLCHKEWRDSAFGLLSTGFLAPPLR